MAEREHGGAGQNRRCGVAHKVRGDSVAAPRPEPALRAAVTLAARSSLSWSGPLGQASEALRLDIEAGYKTALDIAEMVRRRLVTASQSGTVDPSIAERHISTPWRRRS
jgi:hypothetical protein